MTINKDKAWLTSPASSGSGILNSRLHSVPSPILQQIPSPHARHAGRVFCFLLMSLSSLQQLLLFPCLFWKNLCNNTCFPPNFTLPLGLATAGKIIKISFAHLHLRRSVISRLFKSQAYPSGFPSLKKGKHEEATSQGGKANFLSGKTRCAPLLHLPLKYSLNQSVRGHWV